MKRFFKYIKYIFFAFVALVVLYIGVAYFCSLIVISGNRQAKEEENISLFLSADEVHSDIILPVRNEQKDWTKAIPFGHIISKDTTFAYIVFGWGNQDAFFDMPIWNDLSFRIAIKAASGLGKTAVHTTYYRRVIEDAQCREIKITKSQYQHLVDFVSRQFKTDHSGNYINIETDAQYGYTDAFYEANGTYSIFYSCNTWINNALRTADQKHCLWTVLSQPILNIYKEK